MTTNDKNKTGFAGMIEGQDIVTANAEDQALAIRDEEATGSIQGVGNAAFSTTPDYGAGDVSFPTIRLGQMQTPEVVSSDAKAGDWIVTGIGPMKTVIIIPIQATKTQQLFFPDGHPDEGRLQCSSGDGKVGVGNPGGACPTCPLNQWGPRNPATGKGTPPPCQVGYSFVCLVPEFDDDKNLESFNGNLFLGMLNLKKTGIQAAREINGLILQRQLPAKFAVRLGSNSQQARGARGGTFFVPTVSFQKVPANILQAAREYVANMA